MIVVCVFRSGSHFTPEWVEALEWGVTGHTFCWSDFVCLTDTPDELACDTIPLATELPGFWAKMEMFRPGLFTDQRVLYLDLDTVVVGDLSDILVWNQRVAVLSDFYDPANMASGMMLWQGDQMRHIWLDFSLAHEIIMRKHPRRMDHYLRGFLNDHRPRIQDLFPGQVLSYKADLRGRTEPYKEIEIPEEARLVCMHGRPTLTDLDPDDPVRKEWGR